MFLSLGLPSPSICLSKVLSAVLGRCRRPILRAWSENGDLCMSNHNSEVMTSGHKEASRDTPPLHKRADPDSPLNSAKSLASRWNTRNRAEVRWDQ